MSQYHVVEVIFNDENILVQSLKDIGYESVVHSEGVKIGNNYGGVGMKTAHIVINRNQFGGMGDIGFERTTKGFVMHADDYDAGRHGSRFKLKQLNKKYVENKLRKYVNSTASCNISSTHEKENGQLEIHVRIM